MPTELNARLRISIKAMSEEQVENIINKLEVTHSMFQNWLEEKTRLGSKKLNKLKHIVEVSGEN